ncbi:cyclic pyranopterin monophosphate synthase MoaC [Patulibacter americanus]|uniref:cyclic pyranopterin monophosphate synthase MoaC n=1 Tax=Patulibacter americanus TaxID=588672 RepID=UPI0003B424E5|nr:cyclic pyranopterin monophosphate synthase MoaC [Patulibacter americanus]
MSADTIRIDVRLFAGLREHAGTARTTLEVPAGATAGAARDALWAALGVDGPGGDAAMVLAVNREYSAPETVLGDGDELALIPPVSGGAGPDAEGAASPADLTDATHAGGRDAGAPIHADVTATPIDQAALHARVARREAGGIVTFSGMARDVPQLDYEAHEEMARERMAAILVEVLEKHGACAAAAEHRVGEVPWPEAAVVVAVSAPHRGEAFAAAREALDRIKAEAPIWKQEVDGEERAWVAGTLPGPAAAPSADTASGDAATAGSSPETAPADAPTTGGASGEAGERHPGGLLPHLRPDGGATMVDVGGKAVTERRAVAAALLSTTPETAALIQRGDLPKGDVLGVARIAGITAAKRVPDLVPLAHPLPLTKVDVRAEVVPEAGQVRITAEARTVGTTGVEIEAMTAALVAAINVYDMVKGVERGIAVGPVGLVHKSGGRTGDFTGPAPWEPGFRAGDGTSAGLAHQAAASTDPEASTDPAGPASSGASSSAVAAASAPHATQAQADAAASPASPAQAAPGARDKAKPLDPPVRAGLLTVSTSRADGPPDDPGTLALRALASDLGATAIVEERVRDEHDAIAGALRRFADEHGCDLVLTAGGTGCTVDDVTPEATLAACDRQVPGIAEALRLESREHTHAWPLSRGVAAIRGRTLVVNLPGTPKAAAEALPVLSPVLTHAVRLLRR